MADWTPPRPRLAGGGLAPDAPSAAPSSLAFLRALLPFAPPPRPRGAQLPALPEELAARVRAAVLYAADGAKGRGVREPSASSVAARRLLFNPVYVVFRVLVGLVHLALAQWEAPSSDSTPASRVACLELDVACQVFFALDFVFLQRHYYGSEAWGRRGWTWIKGIVLLLLAANTIATAAQPSFMNYARLLRPLLMIERVSAVRKIVNTIAKAFPRIIVFASVLALHTMTFAILAFILFSGVEGPPRCYPLRSPLTAEKCSVFYSAGCRAFFSSLDESMIHIFAMTTGAEFPGAMLPAMECQPFYSTFFIVVFVTGNFMLLRVATALVFEETSRFRTKEVLQRYRNAFDNYRCAHNELTAGNLASGGGGVPREIFVRFWTALRKTVEPALASLIFDVVDVDRVGALDADAFTCACFLFSNVRGVRSGSSMLSSGGAGLVAARQMQSETDDSSLSAALEAARAMKAADAGGAGGSGSPVIAANPLQLAAHDASAPPADTAPESAEAASSARRDRVNAALGQASKADPHGHGHGHAAPEGLKPHALVKQVQEMRQAKGVFSAQLDGARTALEAYFVGNVQGLDMKLSLMMNHGVPIEFAHDSLRAKCLRFLHSLPMKIFFELGGIVNAIAVMAQLNLEDYEMSAAEIETIRTLSIVNYVTFAIFGFEILIVMVLLGPKRYWRQSHWNKADVAIFLLALAGTITDNTQGACLSRATDGTCLDPPGELLTFALVCRIAKVARVIRLLPGMEANLAAMVNLGAPVGRYLVIVMSLLYSYAVLGNMLFHDQLNSRHIVEDLGGVLKPNGRYVCAGGNVTCSSYIYMSHTSLNFNNPLRGFVVMLAQLTATEWPVVMEALVATLDSGWPRLFFVSSWFFGVFVVLNITLAFIVSGFSADLLKTERKQVIERAALRELSKHIGSQLGHGHDDHGHDDHGHGDEAKELKAALESRQLCFWREAIAASGVDFSAFSLFRRSNHYDVYDVMFLADIKAAFPDIFSGRWVRMAEGRGKDSDH